MAAPLYKRYPRELRNNAGKWLGIFLMLVIAISFTTGFLVAASSIERIVATMPEDYQIEDISFTTSFKAPKKALADVEALGGTVYEMFYRDLPLSYAGATHESTTRVFANRTEINLPVYAQGRAPQARGEIALDRVYCANNNLDLGSTVQVGGRDFELVGIVTLGDYSSQFQRNGEFVFNALSFTICQVVQEDFDELVDTAPVYHYSMLLDNRSMDLADRIDIEEQIADVFEEHDVVLDDLMDKDTNNAIHYAGDDVSGDQMMWQILLLLLIVIMAFVFVVLTGATIEEESGVIGTLMASGYRKGEIVRHYLAMPAIVGLSGCLVGNVLGYAWFTKPMQELYYNSYSLPPYQTFWNTRVFIVTTVVPFALLLVITLFGLLSKMRFTPLQFLRHELGKARGGARLVLPEKLPYLTRFRMRVFTRNFSQFVILFCGIFFASFLLFFGMCMLPSINHFAELSEQDVRANHMYALKAPLEIDVSAAERDAMAAAEELLLMEDKTSVSPLALAELALRSSTIDEDANLANTLANTPEAVEQAEKYGVYQLLVPRKFSDTSEEVTVYGIQEDSRYFSDIDVTGGKVAVGQGVFQKCRIQLGETAELSDRFSSDVYTITPTSESGTSATMSLYMSLNAFNEMFDNEPDYFNGYLSDEELNLNQRYVASDLTPAEMTKIVDQMQDSMGSMMEMLVAISVAIYLVLIYLLTKTVLDRSARAISSMKVFGYRDREINKLYVRAITVTVLASLVLCLPLIIYAVKGMLVIALSRYAGNITAFTPPYLLAMIVAIGAATYAVVALLHMRRIRRVPLSLAVKVEE